MAVLADTGGEWVILVDGSSNREGCGAGLVITGPDDLCLSYALRFRFPTSKNEAEYETLVSALRIAQSLRIKQMTVCSNSQLVVGQVNGNYEARDPRMAQYLSLVRSLAVAFQTFEVKHIPREANRPADLLS